MAMIDIFLWGLLYAGTCGGVILITGASRKCAVLCSLGVLLVWIFVIGAVRMP